MGFLLQRVNTFAVFSLAVLRRWAVHAALFLCAIVLLVVSMLISSVFILIGVANVALDLLLGVAAKERQSGKLGHE
jgi:hypothetical protein